MPQRFRVWLWVALLLIPARAHSSCDTPTTTTTSTTCVAPTPPCGDALYPSCGGTCPAGQVCLPAQSSCRIGVFPQCVCGRVQDPCGCTGSVFSGAACPLGQACSFSTGFDFSCVVPTPPSGALVTGCGASSVSIGSTTTSTSTTTLVPPACTPVGGHCWYFGGLGESCSTVCGRLCRSYDPATSTTGDTQAGCEGVLNLFGFPPPLDGAGLCLSGHPVGCGYTPSLDATTTCATSRASAALPSFRRACACE